MYVFCDFVVIPVVSQLANQNKAGCLKLICVAFLCVSLFICILMSLSHGFMYVLYIIRIYHECEGRIEKSGQRLAE